MKKKKQTLSDKFCEFLICRCWWIVAIITLIASVCVAISVICFWPYGKLTGFLAFLFGGVIFPAQASAILVISLISLIDCIDRRRSCGKEKKK